MKKFLAVLMISYLYGQWEPDVRITNYPAEDDFGSFNNAWTIAVKDSFVHIVWQRKWYPPRELYYVRSKTYGANFEPYQQLTTENSSYPAISVVDSFVHIVWVDARDGNAEIYYKRSKNYGTTWEADVRITNEITGSNFPSIRSVDSFVHIVWDDDRDGNLEIYYNRSKNYGATWDINNFRLTNDGGFSTLPSISSIDSFVHIAWEDDRNGNREIYYKRSKNYGTTWEADVRITNNTAISEYPSISSIDSFVYIVWADNRDGNFEIYFNRSKNYGTSWDINNFRLTTNPDTSKHPSISSIDSFVHIVWEDKRDGNFEIYYKKSKDYGISWTEDKRLTNAPRWSFHASVACGICDNINNYDVHVVWTDDRDNNWEIYYKRHKCELNAVEEDISQNIGISSSSIGNIKFWLKLNTEAIVELKVFDIAGRLVEKINKNYSKGKHTIVWKNKPGVYFFSFKINNEKKLFKGIIL